MHMEGFTTTAIFLKKMVMECMAQLANHYNNVATTDDIKQLIAN